MVYTNTTRTDGFGAQYQNIIYCILYYSNKNLPFVYTPFSTIEHNYANDPSYTTKLDALINICSYYPVAEQSEELTVQRHDRGVIYNEIESNMDKYFTSEEFFKIRTAFHHNKPSFDKAYYNVAIHIRVSNTVDTDLPSFRKTDLSYYLSIINHIREIHTKENNKPIRFHIYSQGDRSDFSLLDTSDTVFHLNEYIGSTFIDLVLADTLVTSKSSLSYTAALLNTNEIYYNPFWHPPLPHWKRYI